jgi:hypothetical protein
MKGIIKVRTRTAFADEPPIISGGATLNWDVISRSSRVFRRTTYILFPGSELVSCDTVKSFAAQRKSELYIILLYINDKDTTNSVSLQMDVGFNT